jgi:hypothetical protein
MTGRENTILTIMLMLIGRLVGSLVYGYIIEIEQRQAALEETRG